MAEHPNVALVRRAYDAFQAGNVVVATHRVVARRGDKTLDVVETETMTIENGRIARVDEAVSDQAASDAFWG